MRHEASQSQSSSRRYSGAQQQQQQQLQQHPGFHGYSQQQQSGSGSYSSAQYASYGASSGSAAAQQYSGSSNQYSAQQQIESPSYSSNFNSASRGGAAARAYVSQMETAILSANQPISSNESEEITVNGERGIFLNKAEVAGFRGAVALDKYPLNQDPCPQIIRKKASNAEYVQELTIKYLKPRLQAPGPITIRQEPNKNVEPAPPVIIRQQPAGAKNGGKKIFREVPPQLPSAPGPKMISIPGKFNPPPPRKVIIEKLSGLPPKPDNIAVERWVEPEPVKRQVKFIPAPKAPCVEKPKNIIIEWEAAQVSVRENLQILGVSDADPVQYRQQYQDLVQASQLPKFAQQAQAPNGLKLAANGSGSKVVYELEGDVQALSLVDLDKEGLGEYREVLQRMGIRYQPPSAGEFDSSVQYCPDNCGQAPPPKPKCECPPQACEC